MDIRLETKSRASLAVGALGLALICASLIFLTWSNLREYRVLLDRNLLFLASSLMRSVHPVLARVIKQNGFMPGSRLDPQTGEIFREIVQSGDIRYMALLGRTGKVMVDAARGEGHGGVRLDPEVLKSIDEQGSWHGFARLGTEPILILAQGGKLGSEGLVLGNFPGLSLGLEKGERIYFVLGLGIGQALEQYNEFRGTALVQTGFILGAAAVLFVLTVMVLRRREEAARFQSLERVHSRLLDTMPDGLLTADGEGRILVANQAAHGILGRAPGSLVGAPLAEVLPGDHMTPPADSPDRDAPPQGPGWVQVALEGRKLEVLSQVADPAGPERLVLVRDRTALRTLEERLAAAEKLAALGRLSAGVAHEIRNPLSALRGFAQLFARTFAGKKPEEDYARTMVQEADRLNKVVTDMLFLARPRPLEPQSIHLPRLGEELGRLLAPDVERHKALLTCEWGLTELRADPDMLKQSLLNLAMNSLHALPETGGRIVLGARLEGQEQVVFVTDNGRGMSEEERDRALEPFFTTRQEGTGLGLAIVEAIVRQHGGRITIASRPGAGAVVELRLPR